MTFQDYSNTLSQPQPPSGISPVLEALWYDARGDWDHAHNTAQSREGTPAYDRLHAYLHRKEGDQWNAGYWYRRAKSPVFTGTLEEEWEELVRVEC